MVPENSVYTNYSIKNEYVDAGKWFACKHDGYQFMKIIPTLWSKEARDYMYTREGLFETVINLMDSDPGTEIGKNNEVIEFLSRFVVKDWGYRDDNDNYYEGKIVIPEDETRRSFIEVDFSKKVIKNMLGKLPLLTLEIADITFNNVYFNSDVDPEAAEFIAKKIRPG